MGKPTSLTYGKQQTPPAQVPSPVPGQNLSVTITRVVASYARKIFVQWLIRYNGQPSGFTFQLYRSGSAEGPWEHIGVDLPDTYFFVDDKFPAPNDRSDAGLFSLNRAVYYKVVVDNGAGTTAEDAKKLEGGLDRRRRGIHRKLVRDAEIYLRKVGGTQVAIFKRRRWGDPCPDCRAKTGQTTLSHCSTCLGTGIVDGYWNPVYGYAQRKVSPINIQTGVQGDIESHRIQVYMMNVPQVEPKDVLAFLRDGKYFSVEQCVPTQIHVNDVHQELVVSELAPGSVEYDLVADPWHDPPWF